MQRYPLMQTPADTTTQTARLLEEERRNGDVLRGRNERLRERLHRAEVARDMWAMFSLLLLVSEIFLILFVFVA